MRRNLGILTIALLIGCASEPWQAESVPYPRATPFDSNGFARAAYLEGFSQGYRSESSGGTGMEIIAGPNSFARRQGFEAGVVQARAEKAGAVPVKAQ